MKIALDFDEVVVDFLDALLNHFYKIKGQKYFKEDFKEYKWWPVWKMSREDAIVFVDDFHEIHDIKNMKPLPNAVESIINLMKNGDELIVITARPKRFNQKAIRWIKHHIGDYNLPVIHSGDFHKGQAASKSEICNKLGIKIILEDSPETAIDCANNGMVVVLFDNPWNKGLNHRLIKRVTNWQQAMEVIEENRVSKL